MKNPRKKGNKDKTQMYDPTRGDTSNQVPGYGGGVKGRKKGGNVTGAKKKATVRKAKKMNQARPAKVRTTKKKKY